MESFIQIGEIYREHGLRGELKVYLYSSSTENFQPGVSLCLEKEGMNSLKTKVLAVRPLKQWFLTTLAGIDTVGQAELWRKAAILMDRKELKPLPPGEFYLYDLMGFAVNDSKGFPIGILKRLESSGPTVFLVVEDLNGKEFLVPPLKEWIREINQAQKIIVMDLPEGM